MANSSESLSTGNTVTEPEDKLVLDEEKIHSLEMGNMEKFREQQKMMEELNKKKKAILSVAIQERQKKAKVEAVKLTRIKQELDKLDQMVVSDVAIIRDKIEESSREYAEAQKRYTRAEKEFIESKIDLHRKQETKDQLTEHLYTVIHQNELRKAKKLGELMDKLDMEDDTGLDALLDGAALPPLNVVCVTSPIESRKKGCLQSLALLTPPASTETSDLLPSDGVAAVGEVSPDGQHEAPPDRQYVASETTVTSEQVVKTEMTSVVNLNQSDTSNIPDNDITTLSPNITVEIGNVVTQDARLVSAS